MNYELAKQLKDAGFPQATWCGQEYYEDETEEAYLSNSFMEHERMYNKTKSPTLSELIEACGERFNSLYQVDRREDGKNLFWSAGFNNRAIDHLTGSTPSEAVANLYLSLNEKKV